MTASALALALGCFAVLLCIQSGHAARKSRDSLLRAFNRCRKLLPFIMVIELSLIGLAVTLVLSYETLWLSTQPGVNSGKLTIILGLLSAETLGVDISAGGETWHNTTR